MLDSIQHTFTRIKENKPLILCLTNYVTMDFMANSLLALGAAPLMSESLEEIEELVTISQAVYINIGTLNSSFMERALLATRIASVQNKPVILDPVGAGASKLRTQAAMELLPRTDIIRGNASEIISLAGDQGNTKGVEASDPVSTAIHSAHLLAQKHHKVIVISGKEDFVTNGKQESTLTYGSELMPLITGMGCTMAAVLSAFVACEPNYFQAAVQSTAFFSLCGQWAHYKTQVPGSFRQAFIDSLFAPDWHFFARQV